MHRDAMKIRGCKADGQRTIYMVLGVLGYITSFGVLLFIMPLFILRNMLHKADKFWYIMSKKYGLKVERLDKRRLKKLTTLYIVALIAAFVGGGIVSIILLTNLSASSNVNTVSDFPAPMLAGLVIGGIIGGAGILYYQFAGMLVYPLMFKAKLKRNNLAICQQCGIDYNELINTGGGILLFGDSIYVYIFWACFLLFLPLRTVTREMKRHDELIEMIAREMVAAPVEAPDFLPGHSAQALPDPYHYDPYHYDPYAYPQQPGGAYDWVCHVCGSTRPGDKPFCSKCGTARG